MRFLDTYDWILYYTLVSEGIYEVKNAVLDLSVVLGVQPELIFGFFAYIVNPKPAGKSPNVPTKAPKVQIATVPGLNNSTFPVLYIGSVPPAVNWTYLPRSIYREFSPTGRFQPMATCNCPPNSDCSDPRLCPCARFNADKSGSKAGLYQQCSQSKRLKATNSPQIEIFECAYDCKCNKNLCSLTLLGGFSQKFPQFQFALMRKNTENSVCWVLTSLSNIETGEFLMEITGEIANQSDISPLPPSNFLLPLETHNENPVFLCNSHMGNLSRFLCPSKVPNVQIVKVHTEYQDSKLARLAAFSKLPIEKFQALSANFELS